VATRVDDLHLPGGEVELRQQRRQIARAPVVGVDRLVGQAGLIAQVEARAPGVAQGVDGEVGQQRRLDALSHAIGEDERQMVGGDRPVEVVAEDRVRGLQMRPERELRARAGVAGQRLPPHLGGQGQPGGAPGQEVEVRVALGDEDLAAEGRADRLAAGYLWPGVMFGRQPYGQHPHPVAADGHRKVHGHRVVPGVPGDARFLGAERAALRAALNGHRLRAAGLRAHGLERPHPVVHHAELDLLGAVLLRQGGRDHIEQSVGCGCVQRLLDRRNFVHIVLLLEASRGCGDVRDHRERILCVTATTIVIRQLSSVPPLLAVTVALERVSLWVGVRQ